MYTFLTILYGPLRELLLHLVNLVSRQMPDIKISNSPLIFNYIYPQLKHLVSHLRKLCTFYKKWLRK